MQAPRLLHRHLLVLIGENRSWIPESIASAESSRPTPPRWLSEASWAHKRRSSFWLHAMTALVSSSVDSHRLLQRDGQPMWTVSEQRVSEGLVPGLAASAHQPKVHTGFEGSPDHGRFLLAIAVLSRRRRRL